MHDRLALAVEFFKALGLPEAEACDEASRTLDRLKARLERYDRIKACGDLFHAMPRPQLAERLGVTRKTIYEYHDRMLSLFPRTKVTSPE